MYHHLTPTFSVITVTYNAADVIEDTIQSVISQTYHHIEYIIIDGKSTDGTMDIIQQYRDRIDTVVCESDKGLYDAMNKGMKRATGDYLCFLNAGDSFHEDNTLQWVAHNLTGTTLPDIIYGETQLVNKARHFVRMRRLRAPEQLNWKSFKQGMLVCHQAFWPKRSLAPLYDLQYRFSADFDWCIRAMKEAHTSHNTHLTLIDYLDEGMTTRNRRASLWERFHIMNKHYGWFSTVLHHAWFVVRAVVKQ